MNEPTPVDFSPPVRWLAARLGMALAVISAAGNAHRWLPATGLVLCVWIDAAAGWHARRTRPARSRFAQAVEVLADFVCFIWAPVAWITAGGVPWPTGLAAAGFALAGVFRLARFQAEGLVRGGYRGLPVTYNGYAVPAIGVLVATVWPWPAVVWPVALVGLAAAMVSTRFVVPEF